MSCMREAFSSSIAQDIEVVFMANYTSKPRQSSALALYVDIIVFQGGVKPNQ